MLGDEGLGDPADVSAAVTVTVEDAPDVTVSTVDALSVTWSSKVYVLPAVNVLAAMLHVSVAPASAPLPLGTAHCVADPYDPELILTSHCHENVGVPVTWSALDTVNA